MKTLEKQFFHDNSNIFWARYFKLSVDKFMVHIYQTSKFHLKTVIAVIELYFCKLFLKNQTKIMYTLNLRILAYHLSYTVQVDMIL